MGPVPRGGNRPFAFRRHAALRGARGSTAFPASLLKGYCPREQVAALPGMPLLMGA